MPVGSWLLIYTKLLCCFLKFDESCLTITKLFLCSSIKTTYDQQSQDATSLLPAPIEKLPDASLLLNSPLSSQQIGTDHSSLVATAMAENASRKRDSVESSSLYVRGKIPRGNLPNSKNIPDTSKGLLMPPQLHGR